MDLVKHLEDELRNLIDLSGCDDKIDEIEILTEHLCADHHFIDYGYLETICQYYFAGKDETVFFKVNSEDVTSNFKDVVKVVNLRTINTFVWEEV